MRVPLPRLPHRFLPRLPLVLRVRYDAREFCELRNPGLRLVKVRVEASPVEATSLRGFPLRTALDDELRDLPGEAGGYLSRSTYRVHLLPIAGDSQNSA